MYYSMLIRENIDTTLTGAVGNIAVGAKSVYVKNAGSTTAIFDGSEIAAGEALNLEPVTSYNYPEFTYDAQSSRLIIKIFR